MKCDVIRMEDVTMKIELKTEGRGLLERHQPQSLK